jgi:hypothetical protein
MAGRSTVHIPDQRADEYDLISAKEQLGLFQKSVNGKWSLPSDTRKGIAHFAMAVIANEDQGIRTRINASKLLLSIDALQSQEMRSCAELTLRFEAAEMMGGTSEALSALIPPDPNEIMVDDSPVASPVQGGQYSDAN